MLFLDKMFNGLISVKQYKSQEKNRSPSKPNEYKLLAKLFFHPLALFFILCIEYLAINSYIKLIIIIQFIGLFLFGRCISETKHIFLLISYTLKITSLIIIIVKLMLWHLRFYLTSYSSIIFFRHSRMPIRI